MKKKQRLTGAERRVQLMEIGRSVFASKGYEATSIEEVAQQAGVSKPIVYEHFGAKEGLYAAIVDRELENLVARVSASIAQGTPRQRFEDAVLAFMAYVKEEPAGFAVLTRDSPTAAARRGLTRVIDDLAQRVSDVFRSEFEHAGYPPKVAPIYANALVGMVTQVGHWWAAEGKAFSTENVARHVAALGWMGLRHLPKDPAAPGAKRDVKLRKG
ncbi:TetR/AcrR family transcriptional regulator [Corallococcus sp. AB045]|uniref:TetR/AcrR family transcriptional regulator n=1 Tax=Corallococcus sp. AB045 TaxID=2316719 RepID=UPI001F435139|nr:TetR/AcrR family transcriptional regulator [Corallococcus sp. AB045]